MRLQALSGTLLHRLSKRPLWGAITLYYVCWEVVKRVAPFPRLWLSPSEEMAGFCITFSLAFLPPLPWLWTGDDRPRAGFLRGLLQAIVWNALWLGGIAILLHTLFPGPTGLRTMGQPTRFNAGMGVPNGLMILANFPISLFIGWLLASQEITEAAAVASHALADQSRFQALQAQLNPHSLFNVLGGVTELVREDPEAAEEALVQLADLYRTLVHQSHAVALPLAQERETVARFLKIMEIRLGERLQVLWDWPDWADALELPPLLVYPLVENAIKHGIAPSALGGTIRVTAERDAGRLHLRVLDNGKPLAPEATDGVGLHNLRERLALMRELDPRFELSQEGEWVVAHLDLIWRFSR